MDVIHTALWITAGTRFELQYFLGYILHLSLQAARDGILHQQQNSQIELASHQRSKRAGWMVCVDTEPFFNPTSTCIYLPASSHQGPYVPNFLELYIHLHSNHLHS
jgi:hypothetical protein